jgi:multiple sugar transport system permease protein
MAGSIVMIAPFLWAVSTSFKIAGKEFAYPPEWIPSPVTFQNYVDAFTTLPFGRFFLNSVKITSIVTVARVFVSALAAYAFAKLRFRGSSVIMLIVLGTMMLPRAVILIPQYLLMFHLRWIDTHLPLIIPPSLFFAYGIFLMRQFFITIPDELQDSARIDGCSSYQTFLRVILPLAKPALATMVVISFMWTWNSFIDPLIFIHSTEKMTMMLGLGIFVGQYGTEWRQLMAGTVAAVIPIIVLFVTLQRYYVQGISLTGLKG